MSLAARVLLPALLALSGGCGSLTGNPGKEEPREAPIPDLPPDQALKAADANLKVAVAYMQRNEMERANRKLQRALKLAPDYYVTHLMLGRLYERIEDVPRAEKHFQQALKLKPKDANVMDHYAQFLCGLGRREEAQEYFLQAATNPLYESPEIPYTNLSTCLLAVDRKEEALQYLLRALQINPRVPQALLHVVALKMDQDDALTARAYMQRYEAVSRHTPRSLWLGLQIERRLGNRDAEASYELALRRLYPDSPEAHRLNPPVP